MSGTGDVIFGTCDELERPMLRAAWRWAMPLLHPDGMLERSFVTAPNIAAFARHTSLFRIIMRGREVVDFEATVLSSHIADHFKEISGRSGRESLPDGLFERWRITGQYLMEVNKPFRTRTQVFGREHKNGESLIVPVTENGVMTHGLVVTEYWLAPTGTQP